MTYKELLNKLTNGENFSFARYGDGEFNAILGSNQPHNCDKHQYFKDMGLRLLKIIQSSPDYVMGLQGLAQRQRENDKDFHDLIAGIDWIDADIIHKASIKGDLYGLFEALSTRKSILVSKVGLLNINWKITGVKPFAHVAINEKDCWLDYKEISQQLKAIISPDVVILYCAGMPAEVFIDDIYNEFKDVTQIDIGSAFDPYVGLDIRSYHKGIIDKL